MYINHITKTPNEVARLDVLQAKTGQVTNGMDSCDTSSNMLIAKGCVLHIRLVLVSVDCHGMAAYAAEMSSWHCKSSAWLFKLKT